MDGSCQKRGGENFADSGSGWNEAGVGLVEGRCRADRFFYCRSENWAKGVEKNSGILDAKSKVWRLVGSGWEFGYRLAEGLVEKIDRGSAKKGSYCFGG
jgi:hypothetical protein